MKSKYYIAFFLLFLAIIVSCISISLFSQINKTKGIQEGYDTSQTFEEIKWEDLKKDDKTKCGIVNDKQKKIMLEQCKEHFKFNTAKCQKFVEDITCSQEVYDNIKQIEYDRINNFQLKYTECKNENLSQRDKVTSIMKELDDLIKEKNILQNELDYETNIYNELTKQNQTLEINFNNDITKINTNHTTRMNEISNKIDEKEKEIKVLTNELEKLKKKFLEDNLKTQKQNTDVPQNVIQPLFIYKFVKFKFDPTGNKLYNDANDKYDASSVETGIKFDGTKDKNIFYMHSINSRIKTEIVPESFQSFTVCFWVLKQLPLHFIGGNPHFCQITDGLKSSIIIFTDKKFEKLKMRIDNKENSSSIRSFTKTNGSNIIFDDTKTGWIHICLTVKINENGDCISKIHINNNNKDEKNKIYNDETFNNPPDKVKRMMYIGGPSYDSDLTTGVCYDDFRLYNNPLSNEKITEIYEKSKK
jgi:hypothetical protein